MGTVCSCLEQPQTIHEVGLSPVREPSISFLNANIKEIIQKFEKEALDDVKRYYIDVLENNISDFRVLSLKMIEIDQRNAWMIGKILPHMINIQEINFYNNNLNEHSLELIIKDLSRLNNLKKLEIASNKLTDKSAEVLAQYLPYLTKLEQFNIQNNQITSFGMTRISSMVCYVPSLKSIQIQNNLIGKDGIFLLARSVTTLPSFRELHIDFKDLKDSELDSLNKMVPNLVVNYTI